MDNFNGFNENNQYDYVSADYTYGNVATVNVDRAMMKMFAFTCVALLITAGTAMFINPWVAIRFMTGGAFWAILIAEIAIVFIGNIAISKNMPVLAGVLYLAYSVINGVTLSVIFLVYTASSISSVFFITACMFGVMSIIGFTTKMDLSGIGSICVMGLFGIILASIVNVFMKSSGLDFAIAIIGVIIFVGLTAWDVQKAKQMAASGYLSENTVALFGAFNLYLDFVNLFLKLLRIMGKRK